MSYKRAKKQPSDKAAIAMGLISKNPKLSGILGGLMLTTLVGVLAPSPQVRGIAQNASFAIGSAFVVSSAYSKAVGELQAEVKRCRASAASVAVRASEVELEAQRLKQAEATMKERVINQVTTAKNNEVARAKSQLERKLASAERNLETSNGKLAKAALELNNLKLAHSDQIVAINADAQSAQRTAVDAALVEKQVALDKVLGEVTIAQSEAKTAQQELSRANRQIEAVQGQMGEVNESFNQKLAQTASHVFESQSAVLAEAGTEAEKSMQKAALELQWEKQERIKLSAENRSLNAPKHCPIDSVQGRKANHIQAFIHGLKDGNDKNLGYRMHWMNIAEAGANDIYSYQPCTAFTGTAEDMTKHIYQLRIALRCDGLPKVRHNNKTGFIEFVIPQGHVEPVSDKDMSRLLKSADAFIRNGAGWQRSRITGGSESGKSPTSELLAYSIAGQLDADLYFHNPVANSLKAHMTLPQVSSGDDDCLVALIQLGNDLEAMSNGTKSRPDKFQYHVFDEVDTLITGNAEAIKAIELIIKRGSHYGIGIALLGQSDAVTVFSGMTHSDMNNLVQIAIGENARTFIDKMQGVSADDKKKMEDKRSLISDYCNAKNKALGLIASGRNQDPEAFRYCAVKAPNQPVIFYEMPAFGSLNPKPVDAVQNTYQNTPKPAKQGVGLKIDVQNTETTIYPDRTPVLENRSEGVLGVFSSKTAPCSEQVVLSGVRLLDLKEKGVKCPCCSERSHGRVNGHIRKTDSTVLMRCKTEGCESDGKFRAQILTD